MYVCLNYIAPCPEKKFMLYFGLKRLFRIPAATDTRGRVDPLKESKGAIIVECYKSTGDRNSKNARVCEYHFITGRRYKCSRCTSLKEIRCLKLRKLVSLRQAVQNMAPRKKSLTFKKPSINSNNVKENKYLHNVSDFNMKIKRRESLRSSKTSKEYDLEQKIEVEIKMREGTTRLLAACKHQAQTLEAAKSLLTSNERMSTYMAELQRRKRAGPHQHQQLNNKAGVSPSLAKISLSDLRMPLIWRDTDHFKNKGDYRRFAVFCLVRIGTEIYDTTLLCPVDRSLTDLTFPDVLLFNQIPADFECSLEVYSHILQDDLSIASTPRKIKKTIHSSISRTVGKKLAASLRDELNSGKIGPHFELMASARLTLEDAHNSIHTHDLVIINPDNKTHQLPLFGHFCCRLAVLPNCITQEVCSGDVSCLNRDSDKFSHFWGQLQAFKLDLWDKQEHWEKGSDPVKSITVDRESTIQLGKSSSKEIHISNLCEGRDDVYVIRLKSKDEQQLWTKYLVQHAKDHLRWKHTAEDAMEIQSPGNSRQSFNRQLRQGSLYDETPLIESVQSDYTRPTVQEVFGLTPSTSLSSCASSSSSPTFRERSHSSGGSQKSRSTVLRSHWPFNSKD